MKRTLTGGFLTLAGTLWAFAIAFAAGNNLASSWDTELGRFWSTVTEMKLMVPFVLSAAVALFGVVRMIVELFRKEK